MIAENTDRVRVIFKALLQKTFLEEFSAVYFTSPFVNPALATVCIIPDIFWNWPMIAKPLGPIYKDINLFIITPDNTFTIVDIVVRNIAFTISKAAPF